jgi:hypothetical protein
VGVVGLPHHTKKRLYLGNGIVDSRIAFTKVGILVLEELAFKAVVRIWSRLLREHLEFSNFGRHLLSNFTVLLE